MPNWCFNRLMISGDADQIKAFKKKAKGTDTDLSLNNLSPMPSELENTQSPVEKPDPVLISKYGCDNWWDWRIKNWGTKWDVEAVLDCDDNEYLEYSFDSAWSPPVAWLEKVSKDFPKLDFVMKYEEEGMGFMGRARAVNGETDDDCITI